MVLCLELLKGDNVMPVMEVELMPLCVEVLVMWGNHRRFGRSYGTDYHSGRLDMKRGDLVMVPPLQGWVPYRDRWVRGDMPPCARLWWIERRSIHLWNSHRGCIGCMIYP